MKGLYSGILFLLTTLRVIASEPEGDRLKQEFTRAYESKRYDLAIEKAEHILRSGEHSAVVYYNLGNAAYRQGELAKAILYYERAIRLAPNDEDVRFNLAIANRQKTDKIDALPELPLSRLWKGYVRLFSPNQWSRIFVFSLWLLAASLGLYFFATRVLVKRNAFIASAGFLFLAALTFAGTQTANHRVHHSREAILLKPRAEVKSAPDLSSGRLFLLHEGTKVTVEEQLRGWSKIRLPNGNVGWIPAGEIELI